MNDTHEETGLSAARAFWATPPHQRPVAALLNAYRDVSFTPLDTAQVLIERHASLGSAATTSVVARCTQQLQRDAEIQGLIHTGGGAGHLCGVPVTVKDLFDEVGVVTTAGSKALAHERPARTDAPALRRLLDAGAMHAGRTSMSEFAFSGLGLNPHFGTPPNPFDPEHITGGSTSGGAASVAFGLAAATLGSDTGGSLRIPAAFCGLTGFKPSQASVPGAGAFPLSPSLDCIGPIAPTAVCCARLWEVLSGQRLSGRAIARPMTLLVPKSELVEEIDDDVASAFDAAIRRMQALGWRIERRRVSAIEDAHAINQRGGLVIPEAAAIHQTLIEQFRAQYDPLIAERLSGGQDVTASDYLARLWPRQGLQATFADEVQDVDAVLMPTVAMRSPRRDILEQDADTFQRLNRRALRNTSVFNYLDACSVSLPYFRKGEYRDPSDAWPHHLEEPIGLMLSRPQGQNAALLRLAVAIEQGLASP